MYVGVVVMVVVVVVAAVVVVLAGGGGGGGLGVLAGGGGRRMEGLVYSGGGRGVSGSGSCRSGDCQNVPLANCYGVTDLKDYPIYKTYMLSCINTPGVMKYWHEC